MVAWLMFHWSSMNASNWLPVGRPVPVSKRAPTLGPPSVHHAACPSLNPRSGGDASVATKVARTRCCTSVGEISGSSASLAASSGVDKNDVIAPTYGKPSRKAAAAAIVNGRIPTNFVDTSAPRAPACRSCRKVPAASMKRQTGASSHASRHSSRHLFLQVGKTALPPCVPPIGEVARQVLPHEVAPGRQLSEQASRRIRWKHAHRTTSH